MAEWFTQVDSKSILPGFESPYALQFWIFMENESVFIDAVASSISIAEVLRKINRPAVGSNYRYVKSHVSRLNLSTQHWLGQRHGKSISIHKHKNENVFVDNSTVSTGTVKKIILRDKLIEYVCQNCGLKNEWHGKKLVLRLDHINGKNRDNRLQNLRFLCPNCDSQTDTFCGRNKRKHEVVKKENWISRSFLGLEDRISKISWPTDEWLRKELVTKSFKQLGRELGVSDVAIRKRLKKSQQEKNIAFKQNL